MFPLYGFDTAVVAGVLVSYRYPQRATVYFLGVGPSSGACRGAR